MKKISIALGFLFTAVHLLAVSPSPYTEAVTFSCKFATTGTGLSGGCSMNVYSESGGNASNGVNLGESSVVTALFRPGKEYTVTFSATAAGATLTGGDYWMSFIAPKGYTLIINGVPTDLYTRHFSTPSSPTFVSDTHTIELRPLAGGAAAAGSFSGIELGKSVAWEVGAGALRTGRSAGKITFREFDLTTSPVSRDRLYYTAPANYGQITVVKDGSSGLTLRQLGVPQTVVDLVDDAGGGYWLKFYTLAQATWTGSLYTFTGQTPWRTIRVESPGTSQLKITETEGSVSRVSTLVLTSGSVSSGTYVWTLQEGDGSAWLRTTTHTSTNNGGTPATRDDVVVVRTLGTSGSIVAKTKYHYVTQIWAEEVTQVVADPDTTALTTTYAYYTTFSAYGNYRQVQSMTDPTGNWVSYLYYDDWDRRGQVQTETRPYLDTPGTVQSALYTVGNSVSHDYAYDFSGRKRLESSAQNYTTTSSTTQTGKVLIPSTYPMLFQVRNSLYYTIVQTDAYSNSTDALHTISEVIDPAGGSSTDYSFLPYAVKRPDQSQDSYAYYLGIYSGTTFTVTGGGPYFRTNVWHGSTSTTGADSFTSYAGATVTTINLLPNKSTMDVVIRNPAGLVVRTETQVYTGSGAFSLMTSEDFIYDGAGRLTSRAASNGATTTNTYTNGRLYSTVDSTGTGNQFTYDGLGRVYISTKVSATVGTYTNQPAITTTYTYDGANHATQTVVSGGTHTLTASSAYDLAGRLTGSTAPGSYTTGYAYRSGGKIVTTTLPGGTATKVTETYLDGQLKQVSGSAVVAENYTYWIDSSTLRVRQSYFGGNTSQWTKAYSDWLGRPNQTWKPAWSSGYMTSYWYYNSNGQLSKYTQPGLANTLYTYDTMGSKLREGLDIDGTSGSLDNASDDRITEHAWTFFTSSSNWWRRDTTSTYATTSPGNATQISKVETQLSGFSPAGGSGYTRLARTDAYDVFNNLTTIYTEVKTAGKLLVTTTDTSDSTTNAVQIAYNGLVVSATDTVGVHMTYGYDDLGRQTTSVDPRTGTTTTAYVPSTSQVYTVTDPASVVQATYTYDTAGRVATVTNGLSKVARYGYNDRNQKVHEWGDTTSPVEYTYDTSGRQTQMTTYANSTATFTGTGATNWPSSPNYPQTTTWNFDPATGFLSSKVDAASHAVSYTYTAAGQLYICTNARIYSGTTHVNTTYAYSSTTGELLTATYNDGTPGLTYTYNRLGQVATVADAAGSRTFNYNLNGTLELQSEDLPSFFNNGSNVRRLTYGHDTTTTGALGRLNQFELGSSGSPTGEQIQAYYYTGDGRFATTDAGVNQSPYPIERFEYGFVSNSHLIQYMAVFAAGYSDNHSYDTHHDWANGHSTTWSGTTKANFACNLDNLGRVNYVTKTGDLFACYHNSTTGLRTNYGYSDRSEITADITWDLNTSGVLPGRLDYYAWDNLGNRQASNHNGQYRGWIPNNLNQYSQCDVPGAFDVSGLADVSPVKINGSSLGVAYSGKFFFEAYGLTNSSAVATTLNTADSSTPPETGSVAAFVAKTAEPFTYDDDGNLTSDGRWVYKYDARNQLIAMFTRGAPDDPNAGQTDSHAVWISTVAQQKLTFTYDYLGRRVAKKLYHYSSGAWAPDDNLCFLWNGWLQIAMLDANSSNALVASYFWGIDLSGTMQGAGGVGGLLMVQEGGNSYLPIYDANGNVNGMITVASVTLGGIPYSAGDIVAGYEYDAFGNTLRESGAYAALNPFRYSTKFTDIETGLVYYGNRYYSPSLGRFINKDPAEESGGLNLYGFCGNNGVNGYDYLGMNQFSDVDFNPANRTNTNDHVQAGFAWLDGVVETSIGNSPGSRGIAGPSGLATADSLMFAPQTSSGTSYMGMYFDKNGDLTSQDPNSTASDGLSFRDRCMASASSYYAWKDAHAPNNTAGIPGVSSGSGLGNALRHIPLLGGILGGAGDIVSGVLGTAAGIVTLGQSGTFGSGLGQIGYGIGGELNIVGRDVAGGIMGVVGTAVTTVRDVYNVATFGTQTLSDHSLQGSAGPTGFIGAVKQLVFDALIPDYGMMGGANWGTTQFGPQGSYLNWVDHNSRTHDNNQIDRQWVRSNWTPAPTGEVAPGPIGAAYVLLGTIPFYLHNGHGP